MKNKLCLYTQPLWNVIIWITKYENIELEIVHSLVLIGYACVCWCTRVRICVSVFMCTHLFRSFVYVCVWMFRCVHACAHAGSSFRMRVRTAGCVDWRITTALSIVPSTSFWIVNESRLFTWFVKLIEMDKVLIIRTYSSSRVWRNWYSAVLFLYPVVCKKIYKTSLCP